MASPRGRLPRLLAAALVLAALLYPLAAGALLHRFAASALAVGPIAAALAAGERPADPFALGYRGDPAEALGLPFETVAIATPLGPAGAWLVPGDPAAPLAAIYVHGIAGAREDGYRHLAVLARAGVPVLLATYRNDAGAPAAPTGAYTFGLGEWEDLDAAAAFMAGRGHDRLLLAGESMGAAIIGQFLRRSDRAGAVAAVALDSPALDFGAILEHVARRRGLPLPALPAAVAVALSAVAGPADMREAEVTEVFARFPGPLFVAHGTGDRIVPAGVTDRLLAARTGTTVAVRTGADHLQSWHAEPAAYDRAFAAFLALAGAR